MARGFKDINKEPQGKSLRAREASNSYLLKTSKIDDKRNDEARARFKTPPYSLGK